MSSSLVLSVLFAYFFGIFIISYYTAKGATTGTFFNANKKSPWFLVAFGMIGASLSGVTFISVPGWVESSQFSYLQVVLGYVLGYVVTAQVLLPLYYKLNLVSIYSYLEDRFGYWSYKSGAFFFLLSRTIGASFRLFLVAEVLQLFVFDEIGIPFSVTVLIALLLIWLYTFRGGINTIVWTDALQTIFMLFAVGVTFYIIGTELHLGVGEIVSTIKESDYSQIFFFDDPMSGQYFWKQFFSGAFITIVMTGLDQDMMQKNLTCKNTKEAQKNMYTFSIVLVFVNILFLGLGALLYLYATEKGIEIKGDQLFPVIAKNNLGPVGGIVFLLGVIAAAYSSADSALTSLTTSFCIDFLDFNKKKTGEASKRKTRIRVHLAFTALLFVVIMVFKLINDQSVIHNLLTVAGYTYGPLLGLYSFGLFTKRSVIDKLVPYICGMAPVLSYLLSLFLKWKFDYQFGYELLMINGIITCIGLFIISKNVGVQFVTQK